MKKLLLSLCILSLFACKEEEPFLAFEGDWSGTYSNDDFSGSLNFTIDERGEVVGNVQPDSTGSFEYPVEGNITRDGDLRATAILAQDSIDYIGTLEDESAEGTWIEKMGSANGVWQAQMD